MKIRDWQLAPSPQTPDTARLSVEVSYQTGFHGKEIFWFEFPARYSAAASRLADPWLIALLPLAVTRQEPLGLGRLPVDGRLLENARRLMEIWHGWYPWLKPVAITGQAAVARSPEPGRKSAAFFSAGVDSFFTVLHSRQSGGVPIDELVFIHGADIPIDNDAQCATVLASVHQAALSWQLPVLKIATNLRKTRYRQVNWDNLGNGPLLGAAGLLFQSNYERIIISSTWALPDLHPLGSHPEVDPLYSSSQTIFIHYGDWIDRIDKTKYISEYPIARENLRVCWESPSGRNCGHCLKCLRTMIALELSGKLADCIAFPSQHIDFTLLRHQYIGREKEYFNQLIIFARRQGREDLAQAIEAAIARTARMDRLVLFGLIPRTRARFQMNQVLRQLSSGILPWLRRLGNWINRRLP
jgi:hypothetical protein